MFIVEVIIWQKNEFLIWIPCQARAEKKLLSFWVPTEIFFLAKVGFNLEFWACIKL